MIDSDFKKDVQKRMLKAKNDGISVGVMYKNLNDSMGMNAILNVFEGWKNSDSSWKNLDEMLQKLGY